MKLKKLVAAVCAAAMAVSAVAVTPLFSSAAAADKVLTPEPQTMATATVKENQYNAGQMESPSITILNAWGNALDLTDYSAVEVEYSVNTDYIKGVVICTNGGTLGWTNGTAATDAKGTATLDLNGGTVENMVVQAWWADSISLEKNEGESFNIDFTISSAKLIAKEDETPVTPPAQTALATIVAGNEATEAYEVSNDNFNGFDIAKLSDVTSIVWNVTCTNANNGYANGQVIFQSNDNGWVQKSFGNGKDWQDNPYDIQVQAEAGTYDIALSTADLNLNDQSWFKLVIKAYGGATYEINRITLMSGSEVLAYIGKAPTPDTDIDDGGDDDDVSDDDDKSSVSSSSNAAPVIPTDYSVATSNMVKEIRTLAAGSNYEINLTKSNSVVKKLVIKQIVGKDITITITYAGHTWTVNGKDVDTAKPLNFRKALDPDSGYKLPSYVKEVK